MISISSTLLNRSNLQSFFRSRTPAEETQTQSQPLPQSKAAAVASILSSSRLFSGSIIEMNQDGAHGAQADSSMQSRQNNILSQSMGELAMLDAQGMDNYAARSLIGRKAARKMSQEMQTTTSEESRKNLEELKERLEQKAREATAPKDAEGDPLPLSGTETPDTSAAPEPEPIKTEPVSDVPVEAAPFAAIVDNARASYSAQASAQAGSATHLGQTLDLAV